MNRPLPHRDRFGREWLLRIAHAPVFALAAALLLASCARSPTVAEAETEEASQPAPEAKPFNIRDVFPEGAGRELVLENCQSCHVLVPILVLRMDEAAWYRSSIEHRERVEGLTDQEFEVLYDYLTSKFPPDRPIPKLPPALLDSWTTY